MFGALEIGYLEGTKWLAVVLVPRNWPLDGIVTKLSEAHSRCHLDIVRNVA